MNEAHDDYLQLLVEMGGLGFATMLWFVVVMYRGAVKKLGNWPEDINGAVALAAMLGATGILVHGFVDFNLQIPANASALLCDVRCGCDGDSVWTVPAQGQPVGNDVAG